MKKKPPVPVSSQFGRDILDRSDPLARIVDLSDDAIISVDGRQSIILFNHGAEKMFGYSAHEIRGQRLDRLLPALLAEVLWEQMETFDKAGVSARRMDERREILGRRKDGSEFPAEAAISKIELQDGPVFTVYTRDVTQRTLAEDKLRASLREKQVLIDEIHHRVKNNLQVITSLLGLQARSSRDATARKRFEESQHRIQSMAILHEILHQSGSLAQIDFAEYIRRLARHLFRSYGVTDKVRLRMDLHPVSLHVDAALPCGLIVNELVSNSFKYGFPATPGEVRIDLSQQPGGAVRLVVADNGIGLPRDLDWEATHSLGFRLVRTLASQLEAVLEADRSHGTVFSLTFRTTPVTQI